ncbi:HNH endonuclease family protein [Dietzia natronolimnaea]|uniref:HNH endonuclease family protein n=1 Tax=Dietzia natronolimnaea TaxID=161920 RepID=UPI0015F9F3BB|nr:HNH endonuclease family protein [Dietzia natronolimnaea]
MSVFEVAGLGPAGRRFRYGRKTRFGEDCDLRYRHTLGNLVLTYDNSAYSNKPFRRKQFDKPGYKDSRLFQEKELASSYREWTPTTVMHRQTTIVEWALTVSSGGDSGESAMSDAELELLGGDPDD